MKKYNMIENRPELSQKEVEEGMDFQKVLNKSASVPKSYFKWIIIAAAVIALIVIAVLFITYNPSKKTEVESKVAESTNFENIQSKTTTVETFSVFIGSHLVKGELSLSKEEFLKLESLNIKSSQANSKFKLLSFTFTALTKNGISQINCNDAVFNSEIKAIQNKLSVGQTVYFENILILNGQGKQQLLESITVSVK